MPTNIPLTGKFNVTCEYKRKGNWACGWHTGIDLTGSDNIYATCNGTVYKTGYDNSYGNYVVVKNNESNNYHWYCHLRTIGVSKGQSVTRTSIIGQMGATGNVTGKHLHFEIRDSSNQYAHNIDPANYMGISNAVGSYNSANYQITSNNTANNNTTSNELKTLARNTNLRSAPTTSASKVLYLANTTLYVLQPKVAQADGYTWDKVRIRVNGKEGYMINQNYK